MLLKNCRLVDESIKDILIVDGKIKKIEHNIENNEDFIDIKENYVLPGIIDPHCHFREPGMTHKEDFLTGSASAAAGGITTFLDMPNTNPPTTTVKLLDEKRELAKKSIVNYGFHFGAAKGNSDEIKKTTNIASTKLFMNASTGMLMIEDEKEIKEIFYSSKMVSVHAEDKMVEKALKLSQETGCSLYLCHISKKEELEVIKKYKNTGKSKIFVEVTPHHLFFNETIDRDNFTKMKPPLRTEEDRQALWEAIESGLVDTIGTDHAPHTIEEKNQEGPVYGVPGSETLLPLLLNEVNRNQLSLTKVIRLCCHNPAMIFKIKNKGFLEPGYDADLTVVDMNLEKEINKRNLFTKCKWSPFEGRILKGFPSITIVKGKIAFENKKVNFDKKGEEVVFNE
ncbi:MAG: dihydroorotase [Candidatus Nanoarchaeia archaeon]